VKILFVCTGNICRSPLAEGILRDNLNKLHLEAEVDSAGFEEFHVGDAPDERAIYTGKLRNIDISGHRSRLFTTADFDRFDKIYVMDSFHYRAVDQLARNEKDMAKVDYVMNVLSPGKDIPVLDPWYDGLSAFERVFEQLDKACTVIANGIAHPDGR
jgi:protein-tyrosine phosphatase